MRLAWLRSRSTVSLNNLFILHSQLENLPVLFFDYLLLLAHVLFHFVEGVLSGRYDVFDSLLRRWSTIQSVCTMIMALCRGVHGGLVVGVVDGTILLHGVLVSIGFGEWDVVLAQPDSVAIVSKRDPVIL